MEEVGIVHKVTKAGFAVVRFDRKLACENCNMCLKPREENYVELKLRNTLNAQVGDRIRVKMGTRAVLTASVFVYVIPVVLVGITIGATYFLGNEWLTIGLSLAVLAMSFVGLIFVDRKFGKKKGYFPEITEIISDEAEEPACNKEIKEDE